MRVACLYICSFHNSDMGQNAETDSVVQGLLAKYTPSGIPIISMQGHTVKALDKYFQTPADLQRRLLYKDKQAEPFRPVVERPVDPVSMDRTDKTYGVGVFHVFHGNRAKSDINPTATAFLTKLIVQRHPDGCVRKVSIISCAYADVLGQKSSQLTKLAGHLFKELPGHKPMLAAYSGRVQPRGAGKAYDKKVFMKPGPDGYVDATEKEWTDKE